jgi:DNA polymerase IV
MPLLCRDCLDWSDGGFRCARCGSPRVLGHEELTALSIAHIDCDAFYAAVEKRDNPELRDKPVIIGGGRRGVVSTACYIARTFGVRSAMPMFKALDACPKAVVIKPDMEKYSRVGREVRERMRALTPLVEPLSIDEAFLDLTGTERLHHASPAEVLARFAQGVEREVGITVSVGLSHNKFLAKVASDLDKPKGFSVIGKAETLDFLEPRPVGLIWGVGKAMQERLAKDGIRTIGDLRRHEESNLFRRHGAEGGRLYRLARGIDTRKVEPERETKSVSAETTFNEDIKDFEALLPILWNLSEKVHRRLKAQNLAGVTITLKLKTADFRLIARSRSGEATQLAKRIFEPARDLLAPEARGKQAFRLIGVGVSGLVEASEADRGDLLDYDLKRDIATESAVDAIREKFGNRAVVRGTAIGKGSDPSPGQGEGGRRMPTGRG